MARVYERYGTRITAQASGAITADAFSTASETLVDKASGANADGAVWFDVYVDVTAAPSTEAILQVHTTGSSDGTDETTYAEALRLTIPVTVTDQYHVGTLHITPQEFKAKMYAENYGFTATLYVVPVWYADT